jgi:hypothetical protein
MPNSPTEPYEGQHHDADGNVQPEDPLPRRELRHGPADQRSEGHSQPADGPVHAEHRAPPFGRCRVGHDRQRQREDDGPTDPLHGPGRDQHADGRRQRGRHGRDGEDGQADRQHPPPPEPIAESRPGQEQHGKGEGVGVDDPLQALHTGVQMDADLGQGGGYHQVVEADHERGDGRHHVGPNRGVGPLGCADPGHSVLLRY